MPIMPEEHRCLSIFAHPFVYQLLGDLTYLLICDLVCLGPSCEVIDCYQYETITTCSVRKWSKYINSGLFHWVSWMFKYQWDSDFVWRVIPLLAFVAVFAMCFDVSLSLLPMTSHPCHPTHPWQWNPPMHDMTHIRLTLMNIDCSLVEGKRCIFMRLLAYEFFELAGVSGM